MTDEEIQAAIEAAVTKATAQLSEQHDADIKGLKDKNRELLASNKTLKDSADDLEESQAEKDNDIEALKRSHLKTLEKIQAERDEAFASRNTLMVDNVIAADLATHNVSAPFRAVLQQAWKAQAKVEDGHAVINGQPISDYIKAFVSSDEGKHYVAAPANSGGGATGSTKADGGQGWTKENFSITEFSKLAKENPSEANAISERLGLQYRA